MDGEKGLLVHPVQKYVEGKHGTCGVGVYDPAGFTHCVIKQDVVDAFKRIVDGCADPFYGVVEGWTDIRHAPGGGRRIVKVYKLKEEEESHGESAEKEHHDEKKEEKHEKHGDKEGKHGHHADKNSESTRGNQHGHGEKGDKMHHGHGEKGKKVYGHGENGDHKHYGQN
ncbi:hypothetical protein BJ508DRAFT_326634 [Ascobolus immersus RN42]|uniref:Uncharacterized protein n=1 Tax=Ascobolus immersus RN42 TaxID=1160509 RepID=A0A3N4I589_ASCIM|nr:hypothetical protein BJ508DRAFT_326634 [Ascobolus immersus RN42]